MTNLAYFEKFELHVDPMGIKGLTKALKTVAPASIEQMSYEELASRSKLKVYGVDVNSYLYPAQYGVSSKGKGNHIRVFMDMVCQWYSVGLNLVFVFDGRMGVEKEQTLEERMKKRMETNLEMISQINAMAGASHSSVQIVDVPPEDAIMIPIDVKTIKEMGQGLINKGTGTKEQREQLQKVLNRNIIVTSQDKDDLIQLFNGLGAPYLQADYEADFLLASLYEDGLIDGVISEDCDMLTHGVGHLVRGLIDRDCRRLGQIRLYTLSTILEQGNLTMPQFIDFCILCGCDYGPKLAGVAAGKGLTFVRKYGDMVGIIDAMRSGKIKYKPDGLTIDEFDTKFHRSYRIFHEKQEEAQEFPSGYMVQPELKDWLLQATNYTPETLSKKFRLLSSDPPKIEPIPVPVPVSVPKVKAKAKPRLSIASKAAQKDPSEAESKVPVKVKVKIVKKST